MRLPHLDERLKTAAELFPVCMTGADIGADHGKLACYLLANNICKYMVVSDISAPSLDKARNLLAIHNFAHTVDFRVANGLEAIDKPVQAVAICGMGGYTISEILRNGSNRVKNSHLVLSAHTDIPVLRETIASIGFYISGERIAKTGKRFYVVISACPGRVIYSPMELYLGPCLLLGNVPYSREYFEFLRRIETGRYGHNREAHLAWIDEILSRM